MVLLRPSPSQPRHCHPQSAPLTQPWINASITPLLDAARLVAGHATPTDVPNMDSQTSTEIIALDTPSPGPSRTVHTLLPQPVPPPVASTLVAGHTWLWAAAILAAVRVGRRDLDADSYFERRRKVNALSVQMLNAAVGRVGLSMRASVCTCMPLYATCVCNLCMQLQHVTLVPTTRSCSSCWMAP